MGFRGKAFKRQVEKAVIKAGLAADTTVVVTTRVDTGRARANWLASIGSPFFTQLETEDPSGGATIARNQATIQRWKLGAGPIFMTNSLPYILELDQGGPRNVPDNMTAQAISAARQQLKKARLLKM